MLTRDSQMHWLKNDSARFLWEQLVAAGPPGTTVLELSQALTATFEVQTEAAFSDVARFVEHLARHGVVTGAASVPHGGSAGHGSASDAGRGQGHD